MGRGIRVEQPQVLPSPEGGSVLTQSSQHLRISGVLDFDMFFSYSNGKPGGTKHFFFSAIKQQVFQVLVSICTYIKNNIKRK